MSFTFISFPPVRFPYRFKGGPGVCPHMPFGFAAQLPMPFPWQGGSAADAHCTQAREQTGLAAQVFCRYYIMFISSLQIFFRDFPKKISGNAASRWRLLWGED